MDDEDIMAGAYEQRIRFKESRNKKETYTKHSKMVVKIS